MKKVLITYGDSKFEISKTRFVQQAGALKIFDTSQQRNFQREKRWWLMELEARRHSDNIKQYGRWRHFGILRCWLLIVR